MLARSSGTYTENIEILCNTDQDYYSLYANPLQDFGENVHYFYACTDFQLNQVSFSSFTPSQAVILDKVKVALTNDHLFYDY